MPESVWRLPVDGTRLAVLANCRISDAAGFPAALFPRLQGADLIVTLGGMGDRAALDRLQEIAPVVGVSRPGDQDDMRIRRRAMVLEGGNYRIGCVPDAEAAGLAARIDPFVEAPGAQTACRSLFAGPVDILLHAGTGRADEAGFGPKGSALAPGSAASPPPGTEATFLRLKIAEEGCFGQIVWAA